MHTRRLRLVRSAVRPEYGSDGRLPDGPFGNVRGQGFLRGFAPHVRRLQSSGEQSCCSVLRRRGRDSDRSSPAAPPPARPARTVSAPRLPIAARPSSSGPYAQYCAAPLRSSVRGWFPSLRRELLAQRRSSSADASAEKTRSPSATRAADAGGDSSDSRRLAHWARALARAETPATSRSPPRGSVKPRVVELAARARPVRAFALVGYAGGYEHAVRKRFHAAGRALLRDFVRVLGFQRAGKAVGRVASRACRLREKDALASGAANIAGRRRRRRSPPCMPRSRCRRARLREAKCPRRTRKSRASSRRTPCILHRRDLGEAAFRQGSHRDGALYRECERLSGIPRAAFSRAPCRGARDATSQRDHELISASPRASTSASNLCALDVACDLAVSFGAELTVLHTYRDPRRRTGFPRPRTMAFRPSRKQRGPASTRRW